MNTAMLADVIMSPLAEKPSVSNIAMHCYFAD
jgi:hypothetical protein